MPGAENRQIVREGHLAASQRDQRLDVLTGRSPAFEAVGGDGRSDGVRMMIGRHGVDAARQRNAEAEAR